MNKIMVRAGFIDWITELQARTGEVEGVQLTPYHPGELLQEYFTVNNLFK